MTSEQVGQQEARAHALGALLRQAALRAVGQSPQWGAAPLLKRAQSEAGRASRQVVWPKVVGALAAAAVVVLAGLWVLRWGTPEPLSYEVVGSASDYVIARSDEPTQVRFSDGSVVALSRDARLRVQGTSPRGATIVLERGKATTHVVPRPDGRWSILAGSFTIHVVGTRFLTDWETATEQLTVDVFEGVVRVEGGSPEALAVVLAGQRFVANSRDGTWRIEPFDANREAEPAARNPAQAPAAGAARLGRKAEAVVTDQNPRPTASRGRNMTAAAVSAVG